MFLTNCSGVNIDPAFNDNLCKFIISIGDGQMQTSGTKILQSLHFVDGGSRETLEEDSGNSCVDQCVAYDEDMEQRFP